MGNGGLDKDLDKDVSILSQRRLMVIVIDAILKVPELNGFNPFSKKADGNITVSMAKSEEKNQVKKIVNVFPDVDTLSSFFANAGLPDPF